MPEQRIALAALTTNTRARARASPNEAKALPGRRTQSRFLMHKLSITDVSIASAQSVIPRLATYFAILNVFMWNFSCKILWFCARSSKMKRGPGLNLVGVETTIWGRR
jgi:hypothetical protein